MTFWPTPIVCSPDGSARRPSLSEGAFERQDGGERMNDGSFAASLDRRIEKAYRQSGNAYDWRFLSSPAATLDSAKVAVIDQTPGDPSTCPTAASAGHVQSSEAGSCVMTATRIPAACSPVGSCRKARRSPAGGSCRSRNGVKYSARRWPLRPRFPLLPKERGECSTLAEPVRTVVCRLLDCVARPRIWFVRLLTPKGSQCARTGRRTCPGAPLPRWSRCDGAGR